MTMLAPSPAPPSADRHETEPPLTILHVAAPARYGGLERVLEMLAAGQARRGHRVHVAAILDRGTGDGHPLVRSLAAAGVRVHVIDPPPRSYRRERREMRALLSRLSPDVVHTHGYRADVLHGAVARALGLRIASTVHGFTGGGWKNRLYEGIQRRSLRRCDAVIAVSRKMGAELAAGGIDPDRLHVIPNAWTSAAAPIPREEARRALGIPPDVFAVGWVGRISREKGLDVLIDALPRLADLPVRVVVMGDGPERATLGSRAARFRVAERIDWRGAVPGAGRWMAAFDAWVLSSRTEGTPVTLFEAAAAGAPIVATAVGGVPDVVSPDEAVLVPSEDPGALAGAIRAVHDDRVSAVARAARARERIESAYAIGPWLDAYDDIFRRLVCGIIPRKR
jgi:glycosyltransferase involved in cell wall biosynthesis